MRGQGDPDFYYGNIYTDDVDTILEQGEAKIFRAHNDVGFSDECAGCGYLHLCKTGCPFVKKRYGSPKSYTCLLRKEIYGMNGEEPSGEDYPYRYLCWVHPGLAEDYFPKEHPADGMPSLAELITADPKLKDVYDGACFLLEADGERYPLSSQLTKPGREILYLCRQSRLRLHVKREVFDRLADYPVNNSLYIMLLSGHTVVYGDENREKQEHIMTHQIFRNTACRTASDTDGFVCVELSPILAPYYDILPQDVPCNLLITTAALRDCHYLKQKNNGYYHARAMNLPFPNIEFCYVNTEEVQTDDDDQAANL